MRALISVSDKTGIIEFATALKNLGWELISTSGTLKALRGAGLEVTDIRDVTGFPEICEGRVKTLHPKVHGALLGRRDKQDHMDQLAENDINPIDLVCVNLYPFEATIAKPDVTLEDAIENIDIGGPSMLRSAAKNFRDVTVVCNPEDYPTVIEEITLNGNTQYDTRLRLSAQAFTHTALYDSRISEFMRRAAGLPEKLFLDFDEVQRLRYGENPHQKAVFYKESKPAPYSVAFSKQLQGKELSYNNIQDANAALSIVREFTQPFCVALKHMNPCGAGVADNLFDAWKKAYEADKVSIYGGIVAMNRPLTKEVALQMKPIFLEIVMAPAYEAEALEVLSSKKNLRVLEVDMTPDQSPCKAYVGINGGMLVQDADMECIELTTDMCVTKRKPTPSELNDLNFGWKVVKHVKSNAIVVAKEGATAGVGAGQMNRVGSAELALNEAKALGLTEGLILASDGFLPFGDTVELAAKYGVTAIVQPGGSIRDEESIKVADEKEIAMLFTGMRHFKH
ncbi:MAG: bifunctional phosphoribosylaminoimidazolecarboxamide formyltransferase/IMP cyclohydrolase [Muribaculaceae bacterium]|nr:bifunctional phosphoribosylaminoimidazolecarboxamide formyltransferase/IMP cyclohydrolase [Muribaculaceae bacterium]